MAAAASTSTKKLPRWAWVAAIAGGLVVGFLFLRRPSSAGATPAPASSAQDAAGGGQPSVNGAPADSLNPAVLDALGFSLDTLGTLGGYLAALAQESQQQLGDLAQTTVGASLGLAGQAVQSNADLASSIVGAFGSSFANPVYQPIFPRGSGGQAAPGPSAVQPAGSISMPKITFPSGGFSWAPPGGFPSLGGGSFGGGVLGKGAVAA